MKKENNINHPKHYNSKKVECIEISEQMNFCLGNAFKYLYRYEDKGKPIEDLEKAIWYLKRGLEDNCNKNYYNNLSKINKIIEDVKSDFISKAMKYIGNNDLNKAIKSIKKEIKKLKGETK
jgi:hypothetical protein